MWNMAANQLAILLAAAIQISGRSGLGMVVVVIVMPDLEKSGRLVWLLSIAVLKWVSLS